MLGWETDAISFSSETSVIRDFFLLILDLYPSSLVLDGTYLVSARECALASINHLDMNNLLNGFVKALSIYCRPYFYLQSLSDSLLQPLFDGNLPCPLCDLDENLGLLIKSVHSG